MCIKSCSAEAAPPHARGQDFYAACLPGLARFVHRRLPAELRWQNIANRIKVRLQETFRRSECFSRRKRSSSIQDHLCSNANDEDGIRRCSSIQDHAFRSADDAFEVAAEQLLQRIADCVAKCRSVREGSRRFDDMSVQCLARRTTYSMWVGQCFKSSLPFACSEIHIDCLCSLDSLVQAIYCPRERMMWDGDSFVAFERLQNAMLGSGQSVSKDAIYCRMPAPRGMTDRDVVQDRFLMDLPRGGGRAIVMCSPSARRSAELGKPPQPSLVRAETLLSGYLVTPQPGGGFLVTVMSKTDLGGNVPLWMQSAARKMSQSKFVQWGQRLQDHCSGKTVGVVSVNEAEVDRPSTATRCGSVGHRLADGLGPQRDAGVKSFCTGGDGQGTQKAISFELRVLLLLFVLLVLPAFQSTQF